MSEREQRIWDLVFSMTFAAKHETFGVEERAVRAADNAVAAFRRLNQRKNHMPENAAFRVELTRLLNQHSRENASGTPDYILAEYLLGCLTAYDRALAQRETWHGRSVPGDAESATARSNPQSETKP